MEEFMLYLKRAGIFMLASETCLHFCPDTVYEKYIRLLVEVMLISMLILPVLSFFDAGAEQHFQEELAAFEAMFEQAMEIEPETGLDIKPTINPEIKAYDEDLDAAISIESQVLQTTEQQLLAIANQSLQNAGEPYAVTTVTVQESVLEISIVVRTPDVTSSDTAATQPAIKIQVTPVQEVQVLVQTDSQSPNSQSLNASDQSIADDIEVDDIEVDDIDADDSRVASEAEYERLTRFFADTFQLRTDQIHISI